MVSEKRVILVVDDEPQVAESHAKMLEDIGYYALVQPDPEKVESNLVSRSDIDLVLLDIRMPRRDGLELLQTIKLRRPEIGVVMATVVNDIDHAVRAIKTGAYNYLLKPLQTERLEHVLHSFFDNQPRRLIQDTRFASFITGDPAFEKIFQRVKSFAEADVPILLEGETGTGKELIAQMIHNLSPRYNEKFVAVNVAALSSTLFESELFGYRRGAFTGAIQDHKGYFGEAGLGTLFLDEIGELDVDQQKKLLRVLETFTYSRVGETLERNLEARIVIATNCNLRELVDEERFRADLYYRLTSHCVFLPPLRERPADIELLANYFLRKYCSQFGRNIESFHTDAMNLLKRYPFPGNVRELDGLVSSAVLLESNIQIMPNALPHHLHVTGGESEGGLEVVRYKSIMRTLSECNGNQTRAAEKLGIARQTLNRLLRKYRERYSK